MLGFACGPSFDPNEFMSFFLPESANTPQSDRPYMFSPQFYADSEWDVMDEEDTIVVDENVRAWAKYTGGDISETVVSQAVYGEKPDAVGKLTSALKPTKTAAIDYLKFAWTVDDGQSNPWSADAAPIDSTRLPQLINDAKNAYQTTSDAFLKERYAFQTVKLASELGDYKQAQKLYDQLVNPLSSKSFISDWALCRRAGASLSLGDTALAIYEFAQVFDRCPSRRIAAENSLRKYGIKFHDESLQYAKTDKERAAVYALCAIQPGQDGLDLLKALVHLSPKNPLVELVMAREINRNEYYFFTPSENYYNDGTMSTMDSSGFVGRKAEALTYFDKLREFAIQSAENKELGDGAFWYTAGAYLDYIGKDYETAQKHLDQASQLPTKNPNLKKQIAVQRMLLLAAQTDKITPEVENKLIGYLEEFDTTGNFRLNNAFVATCKQFADLYQEKTASKGGWLSGCSRSKTPEVEGPNLAKAYLLTMLTTQGGENGYFASVADPNTIQDTLAPVVVQQTIAYATQTNPTDFDKRLLKLSGLTNDYLNLLFGRRLMSEHRYAEAADAFAKVDPKTWENENFSMFFGKNPFAVKMPQLSASAQQVEDNPDATKKTKHMAGAVNFPAEPEENPYTPLTFAKRMAELEQQAKTASGDKAAELYYQLGCGAWNLSWYGNAWLIQRAYWSGAEPILYDLPTDPTEKQKRFEALANTDYYTTTYARSYFEKSAKAAKTQSIADRSAYMAARCEENAFNLQKSIEQTRNGYVYDEDSTFVKKMQALRKSKYSQFFNEYVNNHTRTMFHQEMIRECAMYNDFLLFGEETKK
ncbi:hypothetical protein GCM10028805_50700 [Spirosoma harenae]